MERLSYKMHVSISSKIPIGSPIVVTVDQNVHVLVGNVNVIMSRPQPNLVAT